MVLLQKSKRRFFKNDDLPSKLIKPSISTIIRVSYSNKNLKKLYIIYMKNIKTFKRNTSFNGLKNEFIVNLFFD